MNGKVKFWARCSDNETFDDICFYATLEEALRLERDELKYLAQVEFSLENVANILTACRRGDTYSSAYLEMKVIECGEYI